MNLSRKQMVIAAVVILAVILFFFVRSKKSNFEDLPITDTSAAGNAFRTYQTAAKTVYDYFEQNRLAPGGTAIAGYSTRTGKCDPNVQACVAIETERTKDLSNVIAWYVATRATGIYDSSPINCPPQATSTLDAPSVKGIRVTMPSAPITANGQTASATVKPYTIKFVPPTAPASDSCKTETSAANAYIPYNGLT